ncbi:MAG: histidine--tRNA ligase [Pseudothermotoga sp.]
MKYERIKGTNDIYGLQIPYWSFVERKAAHISRLFGYQEIRTPIFESTELFTRSVGEETDIVQKEMYTFVDKGGRSLTLRPEGTAPTIRAYIDNSMINDGLPQRFYYIGPMFRYERPQAGRLRQFHQFGVELIGSAEPFADVEVIQLAKSFLSSLGLSSYKIYLNSIGCPKCRTEYKNALKQYYSQHYEEICEDCKRRFESNVLRLLDCKKDVEIAQRAPKTVEYLCNDCREHYEKLKFILRSLNMPFEEDGNLVRGLDYYTRTVFEVKHDLLGAQSAILAGGRYDGLCKELGGPDLPALGFAAGIERLILAVKSEQLQIPHHSYCDIYVAPLDEQAVVKALEISDSLRKCGLSVIIDVNLRPIKIQLKRANKLNAAIAVIIGENELSKKAVQVKNLLDQTQSEVEFGYAVDYILDILKAVRTRNFEHT